MDLVRVVGVGLMIALYLQIRRDTGPELDPVEVDKMRRRMLDATVLAQSIG